ncbi:hypothetical protein OS493_027732 [Desmophyllum pertusum]|uniref:Uncharacterized protein n=1 Tax=Desmophyllum pertusum TaxID=174260 RepID=A0A9X0CY28_9CNID|nr:hypothetical protein OS493_027732 [Desmophyllum pertusum]
MYCKYESPVAWSGFTVAPCVEYLTRDKSLAVTIASDHITEAEALAVKYVLYAVPQVMLLLWDTSILSIDVSQDNLLPYSLHHVVAKSCIAHKKDLLTTSLCATCHRRTTPECS